jgi:hypothetical protein
LVSLQKLNLERNNLKWWPDWFGEFKRFVNMNTKFFTTHLMVLMIYYFQRLWTISVLDYYFQSE